MRRWGAAAVACAFFGLGSAAFAQVPAGPVVTVDDGSSGWLPRDGSVATDPASGRFVIVWSAFGGSYPDTEYGVFAQRYGRDGTPLGAQLEVASGTRNSYRPLAAMGRDGSFMVVWREYGTVSPQAQVYGRFYDASGVPPDAAFRVNGSTTGLHLAPSIARLAGGNFVVVWEDIVGDSEAIHGRSYDARATALGVEFEVSPLSSVEARPTVAAGADGSGLVAWVGLTAAGNEDRVWTRLLGADGQPRGQDFILSDPFDGALFPVSASLGDRGYAVVWNVGAGRAGGVIVDPTGQRLGSEFKLANISVNSNFPNLSITADEMGAFVVAWDEGPQTLVDRTVKGQRYGSGGMPRGGEFTIALPPNPPFFLRRHDISSDAAGNLAINLVQYSPSAELLRRYGGLFPAASQVDTFAGPLSDGNGVLEPGEAVDLRTSWQNLNGAAQTFGGVLTNAKGPDGASYKVTDPLGDYGTVADRATGACSDCYGLAVPAQSPRPALHWDATADESITPDALGQHKRWRLHVGDSFSDVPRTSAFYRFVETVLHTGLTGGCGGGAYCPQASTTREQMAPLLLVAKEGAGYKAPACASPLFGDVPASSPFCPFIEELARRGVTSGCGGGNYCPGDPVSREQMAVFVLRTLDPALDPPACATPVFGDVPASSAFCRWIEELARRGIATGCGGGNFCPASPVTREQMAVFLTTTFGLQLYGV